MNYSLQQFRRIRAVFCTLINTISFKLQPRLWIALFNFLVAISVFAPSTSHAQMAETCVEDGGTAICSGPIVGSWRYISQEMAFGVAFSTSTTSEASLISEISGAYVANTGLCSVSGSAGPWNPDTAVQNPYSFGITYRERSIAGFSGVGDKTPSPQRPACSEPFSWSQSLFRIRPVTCPTGFSASSSQSYCYRPQVEICSDQPAPSCLVGNPIHVGNGSKLQREVDLPPTLNSPLQIVRYYNSAGFYSQRGIGGVPRSFGDHWRRNFDSAVSTVTGSAGIQAFALRSNGDLRAFKLVGSTYVGRPGEANRIIELKDSGGNRTGWQYYASAQDETETYDANGRLILIVNRAGIKQTLTYDALSQLQRVTDDFGRFITFTYDDQGRMTSFVDPSDRVYNYTFETNGNLSSVIYPDDTPLLSSDNPTRRYHYENTTFVYALTGITDENGARFVTWGYDGLGRAIFSEHAGGADKITINFFNDSATVLDYKDSVSQANLNRGYVFSMIAAVKRNTELYQGSASSITAYDTNGNVSNRTDFNYNKTTFAYDLSRNLETQRIEALTSAGATTPQTRTISTEWHATWRLPKRMAEPKRITTYTYNGDGGLFCAPTTALVNGLPIGALCSKTITETTDANGSLGFSATAVVPANVRTSSFTYNSLGQMLSSNGPRIDVADVSTYTYFASNDVSGNYRIGDLNTVSNALGHVTTIPAYDANGRPKTITDPNGLVTQLTYTPRGWLNSRTVGGLLTQFTYDNVGQLTRVTMPDNSFIGYAYDPAHRLVQITNAAGDKLIYTLDLMGNRTKEEVFNAGNVVVQRKHRVFDTLSRLATELNAANSAIAAYTYDNNGNVKTQTQKFDAVTTNDAITSFDYDPLNRLTKITNALAGIAQYNYDGVDHLVSVTDPKSLITGYSIDGLDNQKQQVSPDTGTTNSTYDVAGNLKTSTDARGKISTYSYDALNRVTGVTFSDTTPALGYLYDDIAAGNFGKGRLTKITDGTGNTAFKYDIQGRLIQKTQTTGTVVKTVSYGYDTLGRMSSITYPSGKVLTYTFDVQGRVASMAVNAVNLVSGITYQPFGPAKSWTWSGGPVQTRNFDLDGQQTSYPYTATGTVNLAYDLGNRITALSGTVAKTYAYDKLDRLTGYGTAITYQYDANGNRSQFKNGTAISTYNNPTTSNKLTSITGTGPEAYSYDLAGNTTAIATKTLAYDARARLTTHTSGTTVTSFGINAIGQRLVKAGATAALTTRFVYGEDGKLLGEYDNTGVLITEHIYLQDTPIAAIKTAGAYVVQADHLNTPRAILGAANVLAWKWDSDAFGTTAANEKPSTLATFNYNLRFPGQYYDKETLTHYNYFRDYNPKTGRYIESDPIGLAGGINTYGYTRGNPIRRSDRFGLWSPGGHDAIIQNAFGNRLTAAEIGVLQQASRDFDGRTQGVEFANQHAMRLENQTPAQSVAGTNDFVAQTILRARGLARNGNRRAALQALGEACHPAMDASSPMHTDPDGTPRLWRGLRDGWGHSWNEHVGNETAADLTPQILQNQERALNRLYDFIFSQ